MKFDRKGLALLTAVVTLTVCKDFQQSNQPSSFVVSLVGVSTEMPLEPSLDKQELESHAAAYVGLLHQGQFNSFYQEVGASLQDEITQGQLKREWSGLMTVAHVCGGDESIQITQAKGKTNVQVTSVYSRYHILIGFTFSDDGTVEALSMDLGPLAAVPESGENWEEAPIQLGYDVQRQLSGMLALPKRMENPPVVILVHGSGAQGVDCRIGATDNRPFVDLAQGLADNGVASIRYDRHSYVHPEDVIDVQTEYSYSVQSAVRFALEGPQTGGSQLYLIGHSQGGMLSPKSALDNPEVKGIVSLGGTLRRIGDVILEQSKTMIGQDAALSEEEGAAHIAKIQSRLDRVHGLTPESTDAWDKMLLDYPMSYWVSLNAIDQKAIARELTIPMLILQDDNDFQVRYDTNFRLWQEVLGDRESVTSRHHAELSHVFMSGSLKHFNSSSCDALAKMGIQVIQDIPGWIYSQTEEES